MNTNEVAKKNGYEEVGITFRKKLSMPERYEIELLLTRKYGKMLLTTPNGVVETNPFAIPEDGDLEVYESEIIELATRNQFENWYDNPETKEKIYQSIWKGQRLE